MSATVTIDSNCLSDRKLTLRDILPEELSYGTADEFNRLDEGNEGDYTLVFDPDNIGRGFGISFEGSAVKMHLNYPNSRHDIELFYMMAESICRTQKVDCFEYEGETVTLDRIEEIIQRDIDATVYILQIYADKIRSGESESITIFGVINPLCIGEKETALFGCDIDQFSRWLNEKQQGDRYYAAPHFYEKPDGSTFGSFAVRAEVPSIIPVKPEIPLRLHGQFEVSDWYVMLGYSDERKSGGQLKIIPYHQLVENVAEGEYYDANHIIVNLTNDEVAELLEKFITQI